MKRLVAMFLTIALAGSTFSAPSAFALSKTRAERVVVQRVKARYFPPSGAFADCHRLSSSRFGCSYSYKSYSSSWCEGGARVWQFSDGIAVTLGTPRAVIDNGGC